MNANTRRWALSALAVAAAASGRTAIIPLQNPGFETGHPAPWVAQPTFDAQGNAVPTFTEGVLSGGHSGQYGYQVTAYANSRNPSRNSPCVDNYAHVRALLYQTVDLAYARTSHFYFSASMLTSTSGNANATYGARVGVDPTGGTDATAPTVIWSAYDPAKSWTRVLVVTPEVTTNKLTVFIDGFSADSAHTCYPDAPPASMAARVYIDDALLSDSPDQPPTVTMAAPTAGDPILSPLLVDFTTADPDMAALASCALTIPGVTIPGLDTSLGHHVGGPYYPAAGVHMARIDVADSWGHTASSGTVPFEVIPDLWTASDVPVGHGVAIETDESGNAYVLGSGSAGLTLSKFDTRLRRVWTKSVETYSTSYTPYLAYKAGKLFIAATVTAPGAKISGIEGKVYTIDGQYESDWSYADPNGAGSTVAYAIAAESAYRYCVAATTPSSAGGLDLLAVCYTTGGGTATLRYSNPSGGDAVPAALASAGGAGFYAVGWTATHHDGQSDTDNVLTAKMNFRVGSIPWAHEYAGQGSRSRALAAAVATDGSVYVAGWGDGYVRGTDFLTLKYKATGDLAWVRRENGITNGDDGAGVVLVGPLGNVYVGGGASGLTEAVKYDPSGNRLWFKHIAAAAGGPGWLGPDGTLYLAGSQIVAFGSDGAPRLLEDVNEKGFPHIEVTSVARTTGGDYYETGYITNANSDLMLVSKTPARSSHLYGKFDLGSFVGDPTGIPLTIQIRDGETVLEDDDVTLSSLSNYSFFTNISGQHDLWLKAGHWLSVRQSGLTLDGTARLDLSCTLNGDVIQSNRVDIKDLSYVVALLGSNDVSADVNGDGVVGIADLGIVLLNFDLQGDP